MSIRVLIKDHPSRSIALATPTHALLLKHTSTSTDRIGIPSRNASQTSLGSNGSGTPRSIAEFAPLETLDLSEYRALGLHHIYGTLGLITVNNEVFLCVVNSATKAAEVRPGETVQKINSVEFHCLSSSIYDHMLNDQVNSYNTDGVDEEGHDLGNPRSDGQAEHPCLALRKLLNSGTFFYSADFDLTRRLQKRVADDEPSIAIDSLDAGFLWNSYMIQPLVDFRSRLSQREKDALDESRILTSAIRGFCLTVVVPHSSAPLTTSASGLASSMTIVSRLSCRRAGTRFNSRGIDDDGNVANFVETETVFWSPTGLCFSYVQIRGSVPIFWEQATGLLPGQQKITITRSPEATQPAFDKHFENMEHSYGAIHVLNLLSAEKPGEVELSSRYRQHITKSPLNRTEKDAESEHRLLRETEYDFHAETRGPGGYEAANGVRRYIQDSADGFSYFFGEEKEVPGSRWSKSMTTKTFPILQQEGVFRTNCLDCLDRTNLIQTILSQMALETFFVQQGERATPDFWVRHRSLWADSGDTLSRIYAGTGALKSSFTRHGKMSLGGVLADARKSATRMYINNFADKGRQNTIDMLLGRLMGQHAVHLYDPINDYVQLELRRKAPEYTSTKEIHIMVATFNLNGQERGIFEDLSAWLCPEVDPSQRNPEIVAVGFQEIVELSPQQIMSTDPARRQAWEHAVKKSLNENAAKHGEEEYVMLRGGQLVGASLSIFARAAVLPFIKNVEGSIKKTGLSGVAGNKGAVAIRMEYANTSLCFVTAHLAAGFSNYDERNRDYKTISQGLRFQRNLSIDDHDSVIWLGDFNYRIGLSNERARHLIAAGDFDTLYSNDQLNIQMVQGHAFRFYSEARITFPPTYKFDNGTDEYDTSEKSRIPAWTDRVLRKGDNLRQINYNSAPLRFSDHRPVYATFSCEISVIDEKYKENLSSLLYRQRKGNLGTHTAPNDLDDSDEDNLSDFKSVESGLPPASSERRKWWLDNSLPAQSTIHPPGPDYVPNPKRPSNPFTPSEELDWVKVERTIAPPPPRRSNTNSSRSPQPRGILPPPSSTHPGGLDGSGLPPRLPIRLRTPIDSTSPSRREFPSQRSSSARSMHILPPPSKDLSGAARLTPESSSIQPQIQSTDRRSSASSDIRKGPPPRPKKPSSLSGGPVSPTSLSPTNSFRSIVSSSSPSGPPIVPPPRRSIANPTDSTSQESAAKGLPPRPLARKPTTGSYQIIERSEVSTPVLPPRRVGSAATSAGLMDERDEGMDGLKDWEVLRPT